MNITRLAIERNRVTSLALLVVLVLGFATYGNMPRDEDPGFTIRAAQVRTRFPGASPSRVELLVTDKLEKVIQQMPEIDQITSQSLVGMSIITVEIQQRYKDMRPIWDDLRRKVDSCRPGELPQGVSGPFVVNDEFGDVFGIRPGRSPERATTYAELKEVADQVRDQLLRLDDVAKVEIQRRPGGAGLRRVQQRTARGAGHLAACSSSSILESRNIIISRRERSTPGPERIALEPTRGTSSRWTT